MAETRTMARPYARAVFEIARQADTLRAWSAGLAAVAAIVTNADVARAIGSPKVAGKTLADAIIGIAGDDLPEYGASYVQLLAANGRLHLAVAIAEQFEAMRAAVEQRANVTVTSAVALSDKQKQALARSLEQRLSASAELTFELDETIIGGAVIRAGDLVIDRSLRRELDQMQQSFAQ